MRPITLSLAAIALAATALASGAGAAPHDGPPQVSVEPEARPVLRNVFRLTLEPNRRLAFQRTAGDWKRSDGEWRLTPLAEGAATRLDYVLHVAVEGPVPAGIVRAPVTKSMPKSLLALRREALSRAGR